MHQTATQTLSLVRTLGPNVDVRLDQNQTFCAIHLPPAPGADYRFTLYVLDDGEPQIGATVLDGDPDAYFWYWPFEEPDYGSQSEREQAFLAAVEELLTSPSRIRQKRGLLKTNFRCEVFRAGAWTQVGPLMAGLWWGTKPPRTTAKVVFYESPALLET